MSDTNYRHYVVEYTPFDRPYSECVQYFTDYRKACDFARQITEESGSACVLDDDGTLVYEESDEDYTRRHTTV